MQLDAFIDRDKRWDERRARWVRPGALFAPRDFQVEGIAEREARPFICREHYSGSYPAARLAVGLFRRSPARLVGVAVFSVPMNQRVIPKYTGLEPLAGVELGRFVCTSEVAYNGESWFLARALETLGREKPGIRAVLSYADPSERLDDAGVIVKPQHWGTIYQAGNGLHVGRSEARALLLAPSGEVISRRSMSKIRNEESGWQYAARALVSAGAPARNAGEQLATWLERAIAAPGFRRLQHPGNLAYVFGVDDSARRSLRALHGRGLPYPRRAVAIAA